MGPAPTTATVSPGPTSPLRTPDLVGGGEDFGEQDRVIEGQAREPPVGGVVGERHTYELGLCAVDQMPEDPPATNAALSVHAVPAVLTVAARRYGRHDHLLPGDDSVNLGADFDDLADRLMAEDGPWLHVSEVSAQDVQVTTADGGRLQRVQPRRSPPRSQDPRRYPRRPRGRGKPVLAWSHSLLPPLHRRPRST